MVHGFFYLDAFKEQLTMRILSTAFFLLILSAVSFAQLPKSGTYSYKIAYWNGESKPHGIKCEVVISGDSVAVISTGVGENMGEKGQVIDAGRLMYHKKSGKWIIGHNEAARRAPVVGGCEEGPTVIDLKKKLVWLC
jgi:hypothetical protein